MPCIKNPIKVAELLLHQQQAGPLPLGRVRPMYVHVRFPFLLTMCNRFLAGEGATKHATAHLIPRVENEDLITESSLKTWRRHMALIHEHALAHQGTNQTPEEGGAERSAKRPRLERENVRILQPTAFSTNILKGDILNDTVGAICVDEHGRVAAGVSSGGISVKFPGRVGEVCIINNRVTSNQHYRRLYTGVDVGPSNLTPKQHQLLVVQQGLASRSCRVCCLASAPSICLVSYS